MGPRDELQIKFSDSTCNLDIELQKPQTHVNRHSLMRMNLGRGMTLWQKREMG